MYCTHQFQRDGPSFVPCPALRRRCIARPEATAATIDADSWLHTGDVGFIDADGHLTVVDRVKELIRDQQVELIVVGMPRNMDGTYGEAAIKAREFVAALKDVILVPIRTWDERLTTVSAAKALRSGGTKAAQQRGKIDAAAAAFRKKGT